MAKRDISTKSASRNHLTVPQDYLWLPGEQWRPILGYEGLYAVSSISRVYSLPKQGRTGRFLTPARTPRGYLSHHLVGVEGTSYVALHRIVCEAFHGPAPSPNPWALHWNDVQTDNRAENLRWGTPKENSEDMKRNRSALYDEASDVTPPAKAPSKRGPKYSVSPFDVRLVRLLGSSPDISVREIANILGVKKTSTHRILSGLAGGDISLGDGEVSPAAWAEIVANSPLRTKLRQRRAACIGRASRASSLDKRIELLLAA